MGALLLELSLGCVVLPCARAWHDQRHLAASAHRSCRRRCRLLPSADWLEDRTRKRRCRVPHLQEMKMSDGGLGWTGPSPCPTQSGWRCLDVFAIDSSHLRSKGSVLSWQYQDRIVGLR